MGPAEGVFRPINGIRDALAVRIIRNTCYEYLTGNQKAIGVIEQIIWYYTRYGKLAKSCAYRLFLFFSPEHAPIGYGALTLDGEQLFVTECVRDCARGHGYGRWIVQSMAKIALEEQRALVAEIWADNVPSISMHERNGFVYRFSRWESGRELKTYVTPKSTRNRNE